MHDLSGLPFLIVAANGDRAEAADEAAILCAGRTLRDDRYYALGTQGARTMPLDIYFNGRHVLHVTATTTL